MKPCGSFHELCLRSLRASFGSFSDQLRSGAMFFVKGLYLQDFFGCILKNHGCWGTGSRYASELFGVSAGIGALRCFS